MKDTARITFFMTQYNYSAKHKTPRRMSGQATLEALEHAAALDQADASALLLKAGAPGLP